jgi:hypothetical protein
MPSLELFFSVVGNKCPPNKESDFKEAMNSETCAGIDLMEIIQTHRVRFADCMDLLCFQSIVVSAGDESTECEVGEECESSLARIPWEISFVSICFGLLGTAKL